ncbi:transcriptional regulator, TetR family protein [Reinekea sp. MED297]|uniref:Transcriptional regulator, TetR family protein n=1 Tax=Reinekea blandensis MED297 TaxID=314283 RepID=A4BJN5_9GAMM|nr:transcriptional regulator, TetR family protein [Reinekea sp. MED297] [Reinekea blandensis MED297]
MNGLKQFVIGVLQCQSAAPSSMCMLVKTIAELTEDQADLLAEAKRLLNVMEGEFADAIRQAQTQGLINSEQDPVRMAQRLQVQFMGLRTYIRAHGETAQVVELVEDLFEHL